MAVAISLLAGPQRAKERSEMERARKEFDQAIEDLRRAKARLLLATDLYLERLEGAKDERTH